MQRINPAYGTIHTKKKGDRLIRDRVAAGCSARDVAAELAGTGRMRKRDAYARALRARGES